MRDLWAREPVVPSSLTVLTPDMYAAVSADRGDLPARLEALRQQVCHCRAAIAGLQTSPVDIRHCVGTRSGGGRVKLTL